MKRIYDQMGFMEQALQLRSAKQQVIASNIANADTPNYKARSMNFEGALKAAIGETTASRQPTTFTMSRTHTRHFAYQNIWDVNEFMGYRQEFQPSVDNNTVDMDIERAKFADNASHYEAILTFINGSIRSRQSAMQTS